MSTPYHQCFPKEWEHLPHTGPESCNGCAFYGTLEDEFIGYCANCAGEYDGERGPGLLGDGLELCLNDMVNTLSIYKTYLKGYKPNLEGTCLIETSQSPKEVVEEMDKRAKAVGYPISHFMIDKIIYVGMYPESWVEEDGENGIGPQHCGDCYLYAHVNGKYIGVCANCAESARGTRGRGFVGDGLEARNDFQSAYEIYLKGVTVSKEGKLVRTDMSPEEVVAEMDARELEKEEEYERALYNELEHLQKEESRLLEEIDSTNVITTSIIKAEEAEEAEYDDALDSCDFQDYYDRMNLEIIQDRIKELIQRLA